MEKNLLKDRNTYFKVKCNKLLASLEIMVTERLGMLSDGVLD
jgi:hypothetical protein